MGRTGHLFQNRFNSEAVEDDRYLMTVIRYIHQNPLKAGMISRLEAYRWSSYQKIIKAYQGAEAMSGMDLSINYFPKMVDFVRFSEEKNQDDCFEIQTKIKLSDGVIYEIVKKNPEYQNLGKLSIEK